LSPFRREVRRTSTDYEKPLGPAKLDLDDLDDLVVALQKLIDERRRTAPSPIRAGKCSEEDHLSMQEDPSEDGTRSMRETLILLSGPNA
jgi:hypothetical protein